MNSNSGANFEEVVSRARTGELLIGVDRGFARRFYTGVSVGVVEEHTGEAPYTEKGLVLAAWVGGPVALLVSAALTPFVIGWWSALAIPVAGLVWIAYFTSSSLGGARLTVVSILLVAAAALCAMSLWPGRGIWALVFLYVAALWLVRFVYIGSTLFLRAFVLRNRKAFEWLEEFLMLREVETDSSTTRAFGPPSQPLRRISQQLVQDINLFRQEMEKGQFWKKHSAAEARRAKAEAALLDYCVSQPAIQSVMSEFQISRHDLQELYHWLLMHSAGQWRSGHWVAASALAYPESLRYILMRGEESNLETVANLTWYFEEPCGPACGTQPHLETVANLTWYFERGSALKT
jgi:hypothetical protein